MKSSPAARPADSLSASQQEEIDLTFIRLAPQNDIEAIGLEQSTLYVDIPEDSQNQLPPTSQADEKVKVDSGLKEEE